jgi:DNA-binding response OmpR family regulator
MPTNHKTEPLTPPRPKIMLVDDDADLRHALQLRLRAQHYEIISACDGFSALALAQKEHPNLIILDLGLPAGDGFLVLKNLKTFPSLALIPVIVLTARDAQGNEDRVLNSGAAAFLQKPADNFELLSVIQMCLEGVSANRAARLPS